MHVFSSYKDYYDDQGRRSIPNSGGMDSKLGMYVCVLL